VSSKHSRLIAFVAAALALGVAGVSRATAAVYQWSTEVEQAISAESKGHPRAFLWIPEHCSRVRAVVIAIQNMEEEQVFEDAAFRRTLAELGFAEVWIAPPLGTGRFRFDQGHAEILQRVLSDLAGQSGYGEIETAPLVPMGHSASASWCWDVAAWDPQRTLAVLSISGQWPYFESNFWGDRSVDQVPGLTTKGEYEIQGNLETGWYAGLKGDFYQKHPHAAFTQVVEPGDGHFSASKEKIELINLYLRKAAQYRLPTESPATGRVPLTPIQPDQTGWLYDVWHLDAPPAAPAAPVAEYTGKRDRAFWAFDQQMAEAVEQFQGRFRAQQTVLIGYRQSAGLTAPVNDHAMVHVKFEPSQDGLTFKLVGDFFDNVPRTADGKTAGWQNLLGEGRRSVAQGDPLPHPANEAGLLTIEPICGPVIQTAPDTFSIRFNRIGFDNPKRSPDVWFMLTYAGDGVNKRMVQQAQLRIPLQNTKGPPQSIMFPPVPDQTAGANMRPVQLSASSSANVPVYYYVREGPAELDANGKLTFTPIPPRAKLPIKVTVVAWQYGRGASDPSPLQSAPPVEREFLIR